MVIRSFPGMVAFDAPGHDMPMVLGDEVPVFVGKREAAITSWFGDDLDTITRFELTVRR